MVDGQCKIIMIISYFVFNNYKINVRRYICIIYQTKSSDSVLLITLFYSLILMSNASLIVIAFTMPAFLAFKYPYLNEAYFITIT